MDDDFFTWCVGVALLVLVMFVSGECGGQPVHAPTPVGVWGACVCARAAGLGQFQDWLRVQYPKAPRESLFYVHTLSLPFFLAVAGDLTTHAALWARSRPTALVLGRALPSWLPLHWADALPYMWALVALNVVSQ